MMAILQLASDWRESFTPAGIPCGAITGLTAQMQNPWSGSPTACPRSASKIKDVESKYYLALRLSVYRDLGATIAANPSTILAIARLGDREKSTLIRDIADGPSTPDGPSPTRSARPSRSGPDGSARRPRVGSRPSSSGPGRLLPRDYWPNLQVLANWTGGTMGAYLRGYPEYFGDVPIRDVGLIASEGRFTIPIADGTPGRGPGHRPPLLRVHPRGPGGSRRPRDRRGRPSSSRADATSSCPSTAGGLYRYMIHDLVRCVGFEGRAPLIEFLNKGPTSPA